MSFLDNLGRFLSKHYKDIGTIGGFLIGGPPGAAVGRMAGSAIGPEREKNVGGFLGQGVKGLALGELGALGKGLIAGGGSGAAPSGAQMAANAGGQAAAAVAGGGGPSAASMSAPAPSLPLVRSPGPNLTPGPDMAAGAHRVGSMIGAAGKNVGTPGGGGGILNYFTDPSQGMPRTYMATQGLSAIASVVGQWLAAKAQEDQLRRQRDALRGVEHLGAFVPGG